MMPSAVIFKRARPALGTVVSLAIENSGEAIASPVMTEVFEEIARLEKILSYHDSESAVSLFNRQETKPADPAFQALFELAMDLRNSSQGAFDPFYRGSQQLDLTGVAKGAILDRAAQLLKQRLPSAVATLNAGGDLCFINKASAEVSLRLGSPENPLVQNILCPFPAIASSSLVWSQQNVQSSTHYSFALRLPLTVLSTVVAMAPTAAIADGLTKVALFSKDSEVVTQCCHKYQAVILSFAEDGTLMESFGES